MDEVVVIEELRTISSADTAAIAQLLGQLSTTATFDLIVSARSSATRAPSCS